MQKIREYLKKKFNLNDQTIEQILSIDDVAFQNDLINAINQKNQNAVRDLLIGFKIDLVENADFLDKIYLLRQGFEYTVVCKNPILFEKIVEYLNEKKIECILGHMCVYIKCNNQLFSEFYSWIIQNNNKVHPPILTSRTNTQAISDLTRSDKMLD